MITVKDVTKRFGPITAVDHISFDVKKGEVLGFLGPNGAGKTTTMKILTCFIRPDGGTATVGGHDILKASLEVRRSVGYVPENVHPYADMTVGSFLGFVAGARGMKGARARDAMDRVAGLCALRPVWAQVVETLSKGYVRRVGLAQALIHDPEILILDEPTDGLDPNQKHDVRQMIKRMGQDKCIIISTHILEEVEAVCSRAIIIARGKILADDAPGELARRGGGHLDVYFRQITTKNKGAAA